MKTTILEQGGFAGRGWGAPQPQPARVYVSEPVPLVPSYDKERVAFARFDDDMCWADRARKRGDRFRADLAAGRAWLELAAALGVVFSDGGAS